MNPDLANLVRRHLERENAHDLASLLRQIGTDPIPALAGLPHRPTA